MENGIPFNRRFWMREGPVRTNLGEQNPDVVRPAGPVDPRVWTLAALPAGVGMPAAGAEAAPPQIVPLSLLVNFRLHPVIVGGTSARRPSGVDWYARE